MGIEIKAVGGYGEVGKNMTALKIDDIVIILDMGIHLPNYIRYTEDEDIVRMETSELMERKAIPDDSVISGWAGKVKAIIPTHAHLDHVGAIPFLANHYDADIICTPFTAEVIKAILKDGGIQIKNEIKAINPNSMYKLTDDITVEFINITHSTPQSVVVAIHTRHGIIVYANDFKFDEHPVLGKKPNYAALGRVGRQGVAVSIIDSIYAPDAKKTPSEDVAKAMLKDVMIGTNSDGKAVIITTFSSHLARLKSIVEFGKRMNRKIIFLGRSLAKYCHAGEAANITDFSKDVEIVKYGKSIKRKLREVVKHGREKYILVVTGHQGEKQATLSKMIEGILPFRFNPEDHIIFSCKTIPTPINKKNRQELENKLKGFGVRIFKDIHVSGHAAREDIRDFIKIVKPENIIPAHGEPFMAEAMLKLALEMGYKRSRIHLLKNSQKISF